MVRFVLSDIPKFLYELCCPSLSPSLGHSTFTRYKQLEGLLDYRSDWGTFRERLNAYESNIDDEANQRKKNSVKKKKPVLKKLKFRSSEDASKKYFEQKIHFNFTRQ